MTNTDLWELYERTLSEVNTHQNGVLRPVRNFEKFVDSISNEIYRERFAVFERNQSNIDELKPFVKSVNLTLVPVNGKPYDEASYPADYEYFAASRVLLSNDANCGCIQDDSEVIDKDGICKGLEDEDLKELRDKYSGNNYSEYPIKKVDSQRWGSVLSHSFDKPQIKSPAMTQMNNKFRVAPVGLGVIVLDYLSSPRKVVFAYTLDSEDNIIYDANNSVAPEWSRALMDEFVVRIKQKYASFKGDTDMVSEAIYERKNK